ncbi:hypothetical protein BDW62DRAFT_200892 [Aspergillus aurantiobrunneus]
MDAIHAFLAQTGHSPTAKGDVVCVSPFSTSVNLLPRLHVYVCFLVVMGLWPFYKARLTNAALSSVSFTRLFQPSTAPMPLQKHLTCRQFYFIRSLLIFLGVVGFAGNIAILRLDHNLTNDKSICQTNHSVLLSREIVLGEHDEKHGFGPALFHFVSGSHLPYNIAHCLFNPIVQGLFAFSYGLFASQDLVDSTPAPVPSHTSNEKQGQARRNNRSIRQILSRALSIGGHLVLSFYKCGFTLFTVSILISAQAELLYLKTMKLPANLTDGFLPHWSIWTLTSLYLIIEAGLWVYGFPERRRQKALARKEAEFLHRTLDHVLQLIMDDSTIVQSPPGGSRLRV